MRCGDSVDQDPISVALSKLSQAREVRSRYENQLLGWQQIVWRRKHPQDIARLQHLERSLEALNMHERDILRELHDRTLAVNLSLCQSRAGDGVELTVWDQKASGLKKQYERTEQELAALILESQLQTESHESQEGNEFLHAKSEWELHGPKSFLQSPIRGLSQSNITRSESPSVIPNLDLVVKMQMGLLSEGRYEEAERLSISFHQDPAFIRELGSSTPIRELGSSLSVIQPSVCTIPSLHHKLALENRLATPSYQVLNAPLEPNEVPSNLQEFAVKVGIMEAVNLPSVTATDERLVDFYVCVSLVSPSFKILDTHGARSEVRAMGKTSAVRQVGNSVGWGQAFVFRSRHPELFEAPSWGDAMPLDGRPVTLIVTLHVTSTKGDDLCCGRTCLTLSAGEDFHQWFLLREQNGKAFLAPSEKPAMIRIRTTYHSGGKDDSKGDDQSLEKQNSAQVGNAAVDISCKESVAVVSATMGFFKVGVEDHEIKQSSFISQTAEENVHNTKKNQYSLAGSYSKVYFDNASSIPFVSVTSLKSREPIDPH